MLRISIALLALSIFSVQALQQEAEDPILVEIPTYQINLDLEPQERFKEVMGHFKQEARDLIQFYLEVPDISLDKIDAFFTTLGKFLVQTQPDYYYEMVGIAEAIDLPLTRVLFGNYVYDISTFCTSIVGRQTDGTIIHGRNLDIYPTDLIRDVTFNAQYMKDGKHIFTGVQFAGTIGLYTGIREGGFSISQNTRGSHKTVELVLTNLELIFKGYNEVSWLIRETLTDCENFECAMNYMIAEPMITPSYLIVAGVERYEGATIARDRFGASHVEMLTEDNWYLVQTNQDHYTGDCRDRCQTAHGNMLAVGEDLLDKDSLRYDVMFKGPTMNDITVFDAIMIPGKSFLDTVGTISENPNAP